MADVFKVTPQEHVSESIVEQSVEMEKVVRKDGVSEEFSICSGNLPSGLPPFVPPTFSGFGKSPFGPPLFWDLGIFFFSIVFWLLSEYLPSSLQESIFPCLASARSNSIHIFEMAMSVVSDRKKP